MRSRSGKPGNEVEVKKESPVMLSRSEKPDNEVEVRKAR
jgi:hypothetical protein